MEFTKDQVSAAILAQEDGLWAFVRGTEPRADRFGQGVILGKAKIDFTDEYMQEEIKAGTYVTIVASHYDTTYFDSMKIGDAELRRLWERISKLKKGSVWIDHYHMQRENTPKEQEHVHSYIIESVDWENEQVLFRPCKGTRMYPMKESIHTFITDLIRSH